MNRQLRDVNANHTHRNMKFLLLMAIFLTQVTTSCSDAGVDYYKKGLAKQEKGDLDGAITDWTKAIELKPDYANAYFCRGCLRYDSHDFQLALVDFRKAVELDSSNDYARFRVWLIRAREGEAEAASTELQTYLAGRAATKPDDWVSEVGRFLTGQLPKQEFLAAAKNEDQKKEMGQSCEAYFYAGSKHLFAGDTAAAEDCLQKSIATDQKNSTEYISAVAELKFLTTQKN
jgi:lipoprotein NlpI